MATVLVRKDLMDSFVTRNAQPLRLERIAVTRASAQERTQLDVIHRPENVSANRDSTVFTANVHVPKDSTETDVQENVNVQSASDVMLLMENAPKSAHQDILETIVNDHVHVDSTATTVPNSAIVRAKAAIM